MQDKDKELIGRNLGFHGYLLEIPMIYPDRIMVIGDPDESSPCATVWKAVLDFHKREVALLSDKVTFDDIIRLAEAVILYREVCPG